MSTSLAFPDKPIPKSLSSRQLAERTHRASFNARQKSHQSIDDIINNASNIPKEGGIGARQKSIQSIDDIMKNASSTPKEGSGGMSPTRRRTSFTNKDNNNGHSKSNQSIDGREEKSSKTPLSGGMSPTRRRASFTNKEGNQGHSKSHQSIDDIINNASNLTKEGVGGKSPTTPTRKRASFTNNVHSSSANSAFPLTQEQKISLVKLQQNAFSNSPKGSPRSLSRDGSPREVSQSERSLPQLLANRLEMSQLRQSPRSALVVESFNDAAPAPVLETKLPIVDVKPSTLDSIPLSPNNKSLQVARNTSFGDCSKATLLSETVPIPDIGKSSNDVGGDGDGTRKQRRNSSFIPSSFAPPAINTSDTFDGADPEETESDANTSKLRRQSFAGKTQDGIEKRKKNTRMRKSLGPGSISFDLVPTATEMMSMQSKRTERTNLVQQKKEDLLEKQRLDVLGTIEMKEQSRRMSVLAKDEVKRQEKFATIAALNAFYATMNEKGNALIAQKAYDNLIYAKANRLQRFIHIYLIKQRWFLCIRTRKSLTNVYWRILLWYRCCKRKVNARLIRQFFSDFERMQVGFIMFTFRWRVVRIQRIVRGFLNCKKARRVVLEKLWTKIERGLSGADRDEFFVEKAKRGKNVVAAAVVERNVVMYGCGTEIVLSNLYKAESRFTRLLQQFKETNTDLPGHARMLQKEEDIAAHAAALKKSPPLLRGGSNSSGNSSSRSLLKGSLELLNGLGSSVRSGIGTMNSGLSSFSIDEEPNSSPRTKEKESRVPLKVVRYLVHTFLEDCRQVYLVHARETLHAQSLSSPINHSHAVALLQGLQVAPVAAIIPKWPCFEMLGRGREELKKVIEHAMKDKEGCGNSMSERKVAEFKKSVAGTYKVGGERGMGGEGEHAKKGDAQKSKEIQENGTLTRLYSTSKHEVKEFREMFQLVDLDHGGSIDCEEFGQLLTMLGMVKSHEELQEMVDQIDSTGKGELFFPDFVKALKSERPNPKYSESSVMVAFEYYARANKHLASPSTPPTIYTHWKRFDSTTQISKKNLLNCLTSCEGKLDVEKAENFLHDAGVRGLVWDYRTYVNVMFQISNS